MGFFDSLRQAFENVAHVAEQTAQRIAEAAEQLQRKIQEEAERAAEAMAKEILSTVTSTADDMITELEELLPSFDDKLQQVIDDITCLASDAADEGVDITEAVNAAVEIAVQKVEDAKKAAIEAAQAFIDRAQRKLFDLLLSILPDFVRPLLESLKEKVVTIVNGLVSIGAKLIDKGLSAVLQNIKIFVQNLVRKVGEVLGPIWKFIKQLWQLLFGEEPEHCNMTMQWFQEKMDRTERQLLHQSYAAPISAVIRRERFFEVLPPDEHSWKELTLGFLSWSGSAPGWCGCRGRLEPELSRSNPKPGSMVHFIWEEDFKDQFGGQQRIQVSVLYFRWRTEEFRIVSSGFLGILAMVSSVATDSKLCASTTTAMKPSYTQPLQLDQATTKSIYDDLAPFLRLRTTVSRQPSDGLQGNKRTLSRQLRFRDDSGVWQSVGGM